MIGEMEFRPLMTVSDLATYLALSKSMVYKLVEEGKLPHIKIGKSVRFKCEDIEAWLGSRCVQPQIVEDDNTDFERKVDKLLRSTTIRSKT